MGGRLVGRATAATEDAAANAVRTGMSAREFDQELLDGADFQTAMRRFGLKWPLGSRMDPSGQTYHRSKYHERKRFGV